MNFTEKSWISRVGIVVIAVVMVGVISIVQYQRVREITNEEMQARSLVIQSSVSSEVSHMLEITEVTMRENLWVIQRSLHHPDSVFKSVVYLIDDNPHVVGGCLSFVPDYYRSKGRLFEPYAYKKDGQIFVEQIAGKDHDYSQNPFYLEVAESLEPDWSAPYLYGPDSLSLITYSYPVFDDKNRLAAVCGLDMDLSWLGDTLNARQPFPSSFVLLLTQDNKLVAGPPESRASEEKVRDILSLIREGKFSSEDKSLSIHVSRLSRAPYWKVVEVSRTNDLLGRLTRVRREQSFLVLLGLIILFFLIQRFAFNERKLRETTAEKARMDGQLSVARNIQWHMLPKDPVNGVYGSLEPAMEVGGDLFDYYVRDGKLFFCIGDVSGKGVPAAMLMGVIHSMFRMLSLRTESPSSILATLNEQLCREGESNMFVTFFAGCLDLYTGKLHYANAGHDKPYLITESPSLIPAKSNLPLGVFPDTVYPDQTCVLSPGNALFLYTDGLTEAKNAARKNFGRTGVESYLLALKNGSEKTPEAIVKGLSAAAHQYSGNEAQSDDLTMLYIQYEPGNTLSRSLCLSNHTEDVSKLSDFIKAFMEELSLEHKTAAGMRLALEETVVNVMNYAYPSAVEGDVYIYADSNYREVRFTVVDSGAPFDPTAVLSPDTTLDVENRPIGGLGILLIRKIMDSVSYCRKEGKNVLTLTKSIV
jgi:serine phosphatase RsbU (regulator of sigma subunit)/anti-sigma regulatory factor (Ser/Thr protein kinase)